MPTTSPDNIYYADTATTSNDVAVSATQASSVQAAFALRGRYSFTWPNLAARTAQTGMVTGSTGYQVDTKTDYIYESSAWRLATPHAEFTSTAASYSTTALTLTGNFTIDNTNSTSSTFVTPFSSGVLNLTDPGIYAVSTVSTNVAASGGAAVAVTGRTFLDLSKVVGTGDQQRVSINNGEDRGSLGKPNVFAAAANTRLYFQFYVTSNTGGVACTMNTRVSITRLG